MLRLWTRLIRSVCFLVFLPVPYGGVSKLKSKQLPPRQGRKYLTHGFVHLCVFMDLVLKIWDQLPWSTQFLLLSVDQRVKLWLCMTWRMLLGKGNLPDTQLRGFILVTSTVMTLGEFGVFNLPSALGLVVPSLVIMCPHHFHFLIEAHFYLFQSEKKGSYVLFEMAFITFISSAVLYNADLLSHHLQSIREGIRRTSHGGTLVWAAQRREQSWGVLPANSIPIGSLLWNTALRMWDLGMRQLALSSGYKIPLHPAL